MQSISTPSSSSASQESTSSAIRCISIPNRCAWSNTTTSSSCTPARNLSDADKAKLKKLNEEEANLSTAFITKLLAATKDAAYVTTDKSALAGLSDARVGRRRRRPPRIARSEGWRASPAEHHAAARSCNRSPIAPPGRRSLRDSWNRAERGGANDTRATIARLAQLRAQKAKLLGFPNLRGVEARRPDGQNAGSGAEVHGRAGARRNRQGRRARRRTSRRSSMRSTGGFTPAAMGLELLLPSRCARRSTIWTSRRPSPTSS